jgi:hypothetical protein
MPMNKQQQAVLNASRGYIKAKGAAVKAFKALCGDDLTTEAAKAAVSEVLVLVRTIAGTVASVDACRKAASGPMKKAGQDYEAVSKAFQRAKVETTEKEERVKVGFADGILRDAQKIIDRIQAAKPEKLTFEVAPAIAGFQAAMSKVRK